MQSGCEELEFHAHGVGDARQVGASQAEFDEGGLVSADDQAGRVGGGHEGPGISHAPRTKLIVA